MYYIYPPLFNYRVVWAVAFHYIHMYLYFFGPNSIERESTNYAPWSVYSTISHVLQINVANIDFKTQIDFIV